MIVTEEEAKTKRCQEGFGPMPMATVTVGPMGLPPTINQPNMSVSPIFCIGSACMAWEWEHSHSPTGDSRGYCGKVVRR